MTSALTDEMMHISAVALSHKPVSLSRNIVGQGCGWQLADHKSLAIGQYAVLIPLISLYCKYSIAWLILFLTITNYSPSPSRLGILIALPFVLCNVVGSSNSLAADLVAATWLSGVCMGRGERPDLVCYVDTFRRVGWGCGREDMLVSCACW